MTQNKCGSTFETSVAALRGLSEIRGGTDAVRTRYSLAIYRLDQGWAAAAALSVAPQSTFISSLRNSAKSSISVRVTCEWRRRRY
jgi:hypothetical protein